MSFTKVEHREPYGRLSPAQLATEYASKRVLISGGGYGVGKSIARAFAEAKVAHLVIAGRTEATLKATAQELNAEFPTTTTEYRIVDVVSAESVQALFTSLTQPIDILVNNAGYLSKPENIVTADIKEWWTSFEVNVLGTTLMTQAYLQARARQNATEQGVVLTINTIAAYNILGPRLSAYAASKAAAWRMTEIFATDIAAFPDSVPGGVRFISVHPGNVETAMSVKAELGGLFPLTHPRLAGEFVAWSASQEASFLATRLAYVNWDVDELVARKDEIVAKDLLRTAIST